MGQLNQQEGGQMIYGECRTFSLRLPDNPFSIKTKDVALVIWPFHRRAILWDFSFAEASTSSMYFWWGTFRAQFLPFSLGSLAWKSKAISSQLLIYTCPPQGQFFQFKKYVVCTVHIPVFTRVRLLQGYCANRASLVRQHFSLLSISAGIFPTILAGRIMEVVVQKGI